MAKKIMQIGSDSIPAIRNRKSKTANREGWSRRDFLNALTVAGAGGLLGMRSDALAAEPPPETTKIKLAYHSRSLCHAPLYVAEELLRGEGFTDVEYVKTNAVEKALASGEVNIVTHFCGPLAIQVDNGDPILILSGLHPGCVELVTAERMRSIRDLKGKTIAVTDLGGGRHTFLAVVAAHVGLDPRKDFKVITHRAADAMRLLAEKQIDAFIASPPDAQELRAKKIGHILVNSTVDRPWSQYFCCMIAGNQDFVRKHPVAAKRALRAILKATNICAVEPGRAARSLVDKKYTASHGSALQVLNELPYGKWREYDPEDTVRFYALRMNEAGMIKSSPQKIISQGTDWRFLREIKKELKA